MSDTKKQLSVEDLFDQHSEKLQLVWIAGQHGGKRVILPESMDSISTGSEKIFVPLNPDYELGVHLFLKKLFIFKLNIIPKKYE